MGVVGKFRTIVVAIARCVVCCIWAGPMVQPDFWVPWVHSTHTIIAAIAGFCLCCALANAPAARLVGVVGKFRTIVVAVAGLFCLCFYLYGHDFWLVLAGYSKFSLENEVFKPFFCGQTVGKYVTFVAATAATRISLRPLPDH